MTTTIYTPYTYLIGWSWLDIWYYGVEYSNTKTKIANPANLWTIYFTSSSYVKKFREEHGEPDIIQVDCIFETSEESRNHESSMIKSFDMVKDPRFLNKHDPKGKFYQTGPLSEETKQKLRKAALLREADRKSLGTYVNPFSKREDGSSVASDMVTAGTCPLLKREDGSSLGLESNLARLAARTHNFLKREDGSSVGREITLERLAVGTLESPWLMTREDGSSVGQETNQKRIVDETHNWLKQNVVKKECPICHELVDPGNFVLHHGDYCKQNPNQILRNYEHLKLISKFHTNQNPSSIRVSCIKCHREVNVPALFRSHGEKCKGGIK